MIYALNLFDIRPEQKTNYRDYSVKAGRIIYGLGGRVVVSGENPETLCGDISRQYFILVEFPSRRAFQEFYDAGVNQALHGLRESSTSNYVWQLFQPWDLKAWVRSAIQEDSSGERSAR